MKSFINYNYKNDLEESKIDLSTGIIFLTIFGLTIGISAVISGWPFFNIFVFSNASAVVGTTAIEVIVGGIGMYLLNQAKKKIYNEVLKEALADAKKQALIEVKEEALGAAKEQARKELYDEIYDKLYFEIYDKFQKMQEKLEP